MIDTSSGRAPLVSGVVSFAVRGQQRQVRLDRGRGLGGLGGVLTEVVHRDVAAGGQQLGDRGDHGAFGLAGHEAVDHLAGDAHPAHGALDLGAAATASRAGRSGLVRTVAIRRSSLLAECRWESVVEVSASMCA